MGGGAENPDLKGVQEMGQEKDSRPQDITFYTFEAVMAREERHIRRLIIALVIAIIGIVVCNMAWLYAWTQYDYVAEGESVETSVELDGSTGGNANYIGDRGIINNGTDQGNDQKDYPESYPDTENW